MVLMRTIHIVKIFVGVRVGLAPALEWALQIFFCGRGKLFLGQSIGIDETAIVSTRLSETPVTQLNRDIQAAKRD